MKTSTTAAEVARTIRVELARRDLTQTDLAAHLGLNQSGMSRRMLGQTPFRLPELEAAAEFFGLSLHDLLPARDDATAVAQ